MNHAKRVGRWDTIDRARIIDELDAVAARRRVNEIDQRRAVCRALSAGVSQRTIVDHVGMSQSTIHRLLREVAENPALLEQTPTEIIDRRAAGLLSDDAMMAMLLTWTFTFGFVPEIGGSATDAYVPGTWDEVERAYYRLWLSDDELGHLMTRNREALARAARS